MTAQQVIEALGLEPLEREGGMVRRTWEHGDDASAIYYLLEGRQFSHLHRLSCDEVYTFLMGDPVELLTISPEGNAVRHVLGNDLSAGQAPQLAIDRGTWQGSKLIEGGWALLSTVCCPGYTDGAYEHCLHSGPLCEDYPELAELIRALCPEK